MIITQVGYQISRLIVRYSLTGYNSITYFLLVLQNNVKQSMIKLNATGAIDTKIGYNRN